MNCIIVRVFSARIFMLMFRPYSDFRLFCTISEFNLNGCVYFLVLIYILCFLNLLSYSTSYTVNIPSIASSREPCPPQGTNSSLGRRGEGAPQHPHPLAAETGTTVRGDVVTGLRPPHLTLLKALLFRHPLRSND